MINKNIAGPSEGTFTNSEKLPADKTDAKSWQDANKQFWEEHSMRYDWDESIDFDEFTEQFYSEIDRRFFSAAQQVLYSNKIPFDQWLNEKTLNGKEVLEIGVGNGSHAQIIAVSAP